MARMTPTIKEMRLKNKNLSEEDLSFMHLLENNLDDTFYVYLEPFLNGDIPKAIIMNNKGNIFIIETSDINLNEYIYDKYTGTHGQFIMETPNTNIDELTYDNYEQLKNKKKKIIVNPFKQVSKYKDDIFGLHVEQLFMEKERNKNIFGIIKTGVYFRKSTEEQVKEKFKDVLENVTHIEKWGNDSDIISSIKSFCKKRNSYMTQELFDELHRLFIPSWHSFDMGENTNFTKRQKELIVSEPNVRKKIRGIAGSGKTLVLAHRAVYSNKRTSGKVLILTYNITLRNYILDRIRAVREDFYLDSFVIKHYHGFIYEQAHKHGIKVNLNKVNYYIGLNEEFKNIRSQLVKYDAILIDEGQDFQKHWFENLTDNFLKENGEFIIFADEKQNIYDRVVADDKKPSTNIIGRWSELNSNSFRLGSDIVDLANKFQLEFFKDKYEISEIENYQRSMFDVQDLLYKNDENIKYDEIFDELKDYILKNTINNNNVSIISNKIEDIRNLEYYARNKYKLKIERTFETKEEYEELYKKYAKNENLLKKKLVDIARFRKFNFRFNRSNLKMSTIHSFKGWESHTLVLIIDNDENNNKDNEEIKPELIYTAITRCTTNLIIYNRGNKKYHNFFKENMEDLSKYRNYAILSNQSF